MPPHLLQGRKVKINDIEYRYLGHHRSQRYFAREEELNGDIAHEGKEYEIFMESKRLKRYPLGTEVDENLDCEELLTLAVDWNDQRNARAGTNLGATPRDPADNTSNASPQSQSASPGDGNGNLNTSFGTNNYSFGPDGNRHGNANNVSGFVDTFGNHVPMGPAHSNSDGNSNNNSGSSSSSNPNPFGQNNNATGVIPPQNLQNDLNRVANTRRVPPLQMPTAQRVSQHIHTSPLPSPHNTGSHRNSDPNNTPASGNGANRSRFTVFGNLNQRLNNMNQPNSMLNAANQQPNNNLNSANQQLNNNSNFPNHNAPNMNQQLNTLNNNGNNIHVQMQPQNLQNPHTVASSVTNNNTVQPQQIQNHNTTVHHLPNNNAIPPQNNMNPHVQQPQIIRTDLRNAYVQMPQMPQPNLPNQPGIPMGIPQTMTTVSKVIEKILEKPPQFDEERFRDYWKGLLRWLEIIQGCPEQVICHFLKNSLPRRTQIKLVDIDPPSVHAYLEKLWQVYQKSPQEFRFLLFSELIDYQRGTRTVKDHLDDIERLFAEVEERCEITIPDFMKGYFIIKKADLTPTQMQLMITRLNGDYGSVNVRSILADLTADLETDADLVGYSSNSREVSNRKDRRQQRAREWKGKGKGKFGNNQWQNRGNQGGGKGNNNWNGGNSWRNNNQNPTKGAGKGKGNGKSQSQGKGTPNGKGSRGKNGKWVYYADEQQNSQEGQDNTEQIAEDSNAKDEDLPGDFNNTDGDVYAVDTVFLSNEKNSPAEVLLDLGNPNRSVVGARWIKEFKGKKSITAQPERSFQFGKDTHISREQVKIAAQIGKSHGQLEFSIVPLDIPPLLSRNCMQRLGAQINVEDNVAFFRSIDQTVNLRVTPSGHLTLRIDRDESC